MTFQPMLASPIELENIKYPVYCSPEYNGIRYVIRDGIVLSRKRKTIPNEYILEMLKKCPDNLDGELIIPHAGQAQPGLPIRSCQICNRRQCTRWDNLTLGSNIKEETGFDVSSMPYH